MADDLAFSYRAARSPAITWAFGAIVVIESIPVHFAVASRHPQVAWALTLISVATLVWLVRDYRAMGSGVIRLANDALHLRVGKRFDITLPLLSVARVINPTFRDLPMPGTNQGRDYLNLTRPAAPNVLILLDSPQRVHLAVGIHREVRRVALRLDDAETFLRALEEHRAALATRSA